ncbi:MAG TPA: M28 family metallopeptidase [Blastocatellia bacterium]|nr:M28 family metallopeptidase [Blastocatellia bacterium]
MRKQTLLILVVLMCLAPIRGNQAGQERHKSPQAAMNPQIQKIVREISADNIEAIIKKLVGFETRHSLSETGSDSRGIGAARRWIKSEFERYSREAGGRLQVEFDEFVQQPTQRVPNPTTIVNVVATLPGKQAESKDRIYVVSGHYDSCLCAQDTLDATSAAPGANDDASGTAAVMEMARVMAKYEFDATLVFMTVAAEEQGLLGSTHWAEMAKQKSLNIAGMITNDIIGSSRAEDGRIDNTHVRLFAEGVGGVRGEMPNELRTLLQTGAENDLPTRQLARFIKELGEKYVTGMNVTVVYRRDRYGRGGDHSPFLDRGYPAVRMTEPNEDYKHQHQRVREEKGVKYGDLPEYDDFKYIAQVARVNAAALAGLALAPAPPANVEVEVRLENDTNLRWEANKEPDLAGYRIVWRETTAPFWQGRLLVGNVTRYTVKGMSKDNYLFGVQAVDKDGNWSVAVYPRPSRPARNR